MILIIHIIYFINLCVFTLLFLFHNRLYQNTVFLLKHKFIHTTERARGKDAVEVSQNY